MKRSLELRNEITELPSALDSIEAALYEAGHTKELAGEMRLVAEEALSNIIFYGYEDDGEHIICVSLERTDEEIRLELVDDGIPFNPLDQPPPDLDAPIEDREEGGLGIPLMKAMTDEASYSRDQDRNVLRLVKKVGRSV